MSLASSKQQAGKVRVRLSRIPTLEMLTAARRERVTLIKSAFTNYWVRRVWRWKKLMTLGRASTGNSCPPE
jgi:hypothetical protein